MKKIIVESMFDTGKQFLKMTWGMSSTHLSFASRSSDTCPARLNSASNAAQRERFTAASPRPSSAALSAAATCCLNAWEEEGCQVHPIVKYMATCCLGESVIPAGMGQDMSGKAEIV